MLILTLSPANWSAKILVNAARPERNTADVGNSSLGSNAQAVEMLMITPPFWRCM
ncbi:hypothetical protein D3C71_1806460 [compost metagenome]